MLRGMWNETPFSFDGQFYKVKESQLLLKPRRPPPQIFTASRSERGLEMVAKYADWWFLDYDKSATDLAGVEDSLRRSIDGMNRARRANTAARCASRSIRSSPSATATRPRSSARSACSRPMSRTPTCAR